MAVVPSNFADVNQTVEQDLEMRRRQLMSVDQTISELSQTLAQLGTLVGHINGQINGITSRINLTLDNFDQAVANIAKDAGSVTYQLGDTVSQVPNSWVFYLFFIAVIIVFILLAVILLLNLVTKSHAIWKIIKTKEGSDQRALIPSRDSSAFTKSPAVVTPYSQQRMEHEREDHRRPGHVGIPMESEPRRVGMGRRVSDQPSVEEVRPYQRRVDNEGAKYNLETQMTSPYNHQNAPRSLEV